jgi:hypothetical protein
MTIHSPVPEPPASDGAHDSVHPIVIDLGRKKKELIRKLKRGRGKLMDEVFAAIEQTRDALSENGDGQIVPVILIYRRKRKKSKRGIFSF